jgi:uncharacterized protein
MSATPIGERVELIDSLRGFALAGVLLANTMAFSLYAYLPADARLALPTAPLDRLLAPAVAVLVTGKFITLFSLLFGVGFAMNMDRAPGDPARSKRYVRRLVVLLAIGAGHVLAWHGDILRYYAIVGLLLLPLAAWRPRSLVLLGVVLGVFAYPLTRHLVDPLLPTAAARQDAYAEALTAFASADWGTMLRGNQHFNVWMLLEYWPLALVVAGRLMIGAALGKRGVLHHPERHAAFWRRLLASTLPAGLGLTLVVLLVDYRMGPFAALAEPGNAIALGVLRNGAPLLLGLGYMAAFVLLRDTAPMRRLSAWLAPVGRMALTNYLLQTALGIAVFYGVGLGIGPRFGMVGVVVAATVVFGLQAALSRWWLERFRFGPTEWLWRSATYQRWQPMRAGLRGPARERA